MGEKMGPVLQLPYHEALSRERDMVAEVVHHRDIRWMIWQTPAGIVVPRSHAHYDKFEPAIASSKARGWSVFLRDTGGGAVVQGPDVINFSMSFISGPDVGDRIGSAYRLLCQPLMAMLRSRGIEGAYRAVSGSMCDGAYNVVVANRKLAGTAQRWKGLGRDHPQEYAVLAHFAMFVNLDLSAAADAINAFYADMGVASGVQAQTHINWREIDQPPRENLLHALTDELNAHCRRLRGRR